jgi:hypothetical protein
MSGGSGIGGLPLTPTRFLVAVLIPGIISVSPWLMLLAEQWPQSWIFYERYPVLGNALLLSTVTIVGSVIEGVGSYVESTWDAAREREFAVVENWYAYLAQDSSPEPVGHRYIGRLVTSMYFELGMMISTPVLLGGVIAMGFWTELQIPCAVTAILLLLAGVALWFFLTAARDSHLALCRVRRELVSRRSTNTQVRADHAEAK